MSSRLFLLFCPVSVIILISGCDVSINPSGPIQPRLVVYSILTTFSDTQYVRVYSSMSLNSEETSVNDAIVTVTDGSNTYAFRYMPISGPNTSRHKNNIDIYYAYPFRPQENKEYTLTVATTTMGTATAKTRIPGKGSIECYTLAELYGGSIQPVVARFTLDDLAKAYLVRMYIVYTADNPWEPEETRTKEKYFEVPSFWKVLDYNYELHLKIFPSPTRRISPPGQKYYLAATFPYPTRQESVYHIVHHNFNARFKRAVFYLIQFDEPWYKYYATGNLFQDRLAVRLDSPDYSNIEGGFGLFGSLRVDSTVVPLPEYIQPYR